MSLYDIQVKTLRGETLSMDQFKGKVLLIVNTASECGFTGQYEDLEKLHEEFSAKGLVVMGFPCNQFGQQEPGDEAAIEQFCTTKFGIKFPMFAKVDVNGDKAHPLFQHLKQAAPGVLGSEGIKWNFTKFLVSKDGSRVERFAPTTKPSQLSEQIQEWLK